MLDETYNRSLFKIRFLLTKCHELIFTIEATMACREDGDYGTTFTKVTHLFLICGAVKSPLLSHRYVGRKELNIFDELKSVKSGS